ncbi:hypothetical protein I7I48_07456 [Histoplasma ohiense]|nr:hypothetical protein I7I48_07456 [Histoplasma ohiense (nom. inval.)]
MCSILDALNSRRTGSKLQISVIPATKKLDRRIIHQTIFAKSKCDNRTAWKKRRTASRLSRVGRNDSIHLPKNNNYRIEMQERNPSY